jgi:hypothetical protein
MRRTAPCARLLRLLPRWPTAWRRRNEGGRREQLVEKAASLTPAGPRHVKLTLCPRKTYVEEPAFLIDVPLLDLTPKGDLALLDTGEEHHFELESLR